MSGVITDNMKNKGVENMRKLNEIWKTKEGSKTVWKLQAPKGVLTFRTKKQAIAWQQATNI